MHKKNSTVKAVELVSITEKNGLLEDNNIRQILYPLGSKSSSEIGWTIDRRLGLSEKQSRI